MKYTRLILSSVFLMALCSVSQIATGATAKVTSSICPEMSCAGVCSSTYTGQCCEFGTEVISCEERN